MGNPFQGDTPGVGNTYSAQIAGTKADVTTNPNVLIYGIQGLNTTAAVAYLQIFDLQSGAVTLGTTAPTMSFGIPANGQLNINFDKPIRLSTGFTIGGTTARSGATGAAIDVNIVYASKP